MERGSIETDFLAQSSYVGVPVEVFNAAIDDSELHRMLREHIASVVNYLNGLSDYKSPVYPEALLAVPLSNYLEQIRAEQGTIPTEEQYDQLDAVAKDSSEVIRSEVCLLDLDLIKDRPVFQQVLQNVRDALVPSVLLLTFCTIGIFLLKKNGGSGWKHSLSDFGFPA